MQNDLIEFKPVPEFQKAVVLQGSFGSNEPQASFRGALHLHEKHLAKGQDLTRKEKPFTVDRREYNTWLKQKGFI